MIVKYLLYKAEATRSSCELVESHNDSLNITTFPKQLMNLKRKEKWNWKIQKAGFYLVDTCSSVV